MKSEKGISLSTLIIIITIIVLIGGIGVYLIITNLKTDADESENIIQK